jgi:hypothetical protein
MVINEFFDEAMVMLAYGFKHMQESGASNEEMTKTARAMSSAISQFSATCINNDDISHLTIEEN